MAEEYVVARLHDLVYRTQPVPPRYGVLNPVAAVQELRAWVDDDHQWSEDAQRQNWQSLLEDVLASFGKLPHATSTLLESEVEAPLTVLRAALDSIDRDRHAAFDDLLRARLADSERALRSALSGAPLLVVCWEDLQRAIRKTNYTRETETLALLASLSEFQGQPWPELSKRIGRILGDEESEVARVLAEFGDMTDPEPQARTRRAGLSAGERLALARGLLERAPERAIRIVWLAYLDGQLPRMVVPLGDAVTLYEGRWLRAVLASWEQSEHAHEHVPSEVAEHRDECLLSWEHDGDENRPFVLIRVALGEGPVPAALDEGRDTGQALLALAAFYNSGRAVWSETGSVIVFADGEPRLRTLGFGDGDSPDGQGKPSDKDRGALLLEELAPTIAGHLPVKDERVRAALELLRWLLEAGRTWAPANFLLCDRIMERVSGWAGERDPSRFAREQLALSWSRERLTGEIAEATRRAVYAIDAPLSAPSEPARREAFLEAIGSRGIIKQGPGLRDRVNLRAAVQEMEWLMSWQRAGSETARHLDELAARIASPEATLRTLKASTADFMVLIERARRTRNAIAHGGPISDGTLANVGGFYEQIASDALNEALYACMTGLDMRSHFGSRQARHDQMLERLREGVQAASALFWDP
jgi:hypothetical protein